MTYAPGIAHALVIWAFVMWLGFSDFGFCWTC